MYKHKLGDRVKLAGGFLVEIVALTVYHSQALNRDLPKYTVRAVFGGRLDSQAFDIHESEIQ